MDEFPLVLESVSTGNVYRFINSSTGLCLSLGDDHGGTRVVGRLYKDLYPVDHPNWIRVEPELIPYDPTQQGETEDDI